MNEHDDQHDELHELLDSTAPTTPDLTPGERVTAVTARARAARRRNALVLAASVVLVAGVAVGVPLALRGDNGAPDRSAVADGGTDTSSSSPTPEPVAEPAACPVKPIDAESVGSVDSVPTGAVSARLCPATFESAQGKPSLGNLPAEPLIDDVDGFVGEISSLPAYEPEDECAYTSYAPSPWSLQVSYPDGSTVTLGTTLIPCSSVEIDGAPRSSALIIEGFTDAAASQQGGAVAPACPKRTGDFLRTLEPAPDTYVGTFDDFAPATASVCYGIDPLGGREYANNHGPLPADDLTRLWQDVTEHHTTAASRPGMCTDTGPTRLVVVADVEGQIVTLTDTDCTGEFTSAFGFWDPSARSDEILTQALGGRRTQS